MDVELDQVNTLPCTGYGLFLAENLENPSDDEALINQHYRNTIADRVGH